MELHFSEFFEVDPQILRDYGAFDISVVSDLPMFIDPFLLFNSARTDYQELHRSIIRYLVYLRDKADADLDPSLVKYLYRFKEVKQNWLGFTVLGNTGNGLGREFAASLHASLNSILTNFGEEKITRDSHLEKLCLLGPGVGRDHISDFATNLIKQYLCEYTQAFALEHLSKNRRQRFAVARACFNYETESWETRHYELPVLRNDFVLLTPMDMLTRDDTWISQSDLFNRFSTVADAIPDDELRAKVNNYLERQLSKEPTRKERAEAAEKTIRRFPAILDYYIRYKEDTGNAARAQSAQRVDDTDKVFVRQLKQLVAQLEAETDFYERPITSYDEALARARHFKHYVENQDGYRLINGAGRPFSNENDVQLYFGLVWYGSEFDINREPNNGRGPVDFKVSKGSIDKSLIEFKLGSNSRLKRNLEKQVEIYEAANQTRASVKVIVCYDKKQLDRVTTILKDLGLAGEESIVVIDARNDNKPSASKA